MRVVKAVAAVCASAFGTIIGPAITLPPVSAAAPIFIDYVKSAPGPRGAITVLGDSVMLGSVLETNGYGPSLPQMLVDRGWGPVDAKAGVGFQAGLNVRSNPGADMSRWVRDERALGRDSRSTLSASGPTMSSGAAAARHARSATSPASSTRSVAITRSGGR